VDQPGCRDDRGQQHRAEHGGSREVQPATATDAEPRDRDQGQQPGGCGRTEAELGTGRCGHDGTVVRDPRHGRRAGGDHRDAQVLGERDEARVGTQVVGGGNDRGRPPGAIPSVALLRLTSPVRASAYAAARLTATVPTVTSRSGPPFGATWRSASGAR
jgi:hypothetical protein